MKDEFTYKVVFWAMMGILVIAAWMAITVNVLNQVDEIDELFEPKVEIPQYDAVLKVIDTVYFYDSAGKATGAKMLVRIPDN